MFFEVAENGKIMICSEDKIKPNMVELSPPAEFIPEKMHEWIYTDGVWTHTPDEEPEYKPTQEERIKALEEALTAIEEGIASV